MAKKTHKLTEEDAALIRDAMAERARLLKEAERLSPKAVGEKFDVSPSAIYSVASGRSFSNNRWVRSW